MPLIGRLLVAVSLAGIAIVPLIFALMGVFDSDETAKDDIAGAGGLAIFALPVWGLLLVLGQRLSQPDAHKLLAKDPRSPVLLLRSFGDDPKKVRSKNILTRYMFFGLRKEQRLEAAISDEMRALGPFVAIGQPGERLPKLGAARAYHTDDDWQSVVLDWIERARIVVMVAGRSDWVLWELRQMRDGGHLPKLLVLLPPGPADDRAARLQLIDGCLKEQGLDLGVGALDAETVLGLHFHPEGAITVIRSGTAKQVDYELAIRLAVFGMFKTGPPASDPV